MRNVSLDFIYCGKCKYYADHGGNVGHCNLGRYFSDKSDFLRGMILTPNFFCDFGELNVNDLSGQVNIKDFKIMEGY